MSLRNLLVPVLDHGEQNAALAAGFSLAKICSSHLTGLHVMTDPRTAIPFIGEGLTVEVIQDLCDAAEKEGRAKAGKARKLFDQAAQSYGFPYNGGTAEASKPSAAWQEKTGFFAEMLGRTARLADLTIIPHPKSIAKPGPEDFLNEVLFRSGRPLLLAPQTAPRKLGETLLVAWNGRAEAARTVASALPLLGRAGRVKLLTIGQEKEDRPGLGELQHYLACHGIKSDRVSKQPGDKSVGATILDSAEEFSADLIVMGAYSHNRWREMVLGGVTRYVIENTSVPIFMSH